MCKELSIIYICTLDGGPRAEIQRSITKSIHYYLWTDFSFFVQGPMSVCICMYLLYLAYTCTHARTYVHAYTYIHTECSGGFCFLMILEHEPKTWIELDEKGGRLYDSHSNGHRDTMTTQKVLVTTNYSTKSCRAHRRHLTMAMVCVE